jgi:hypothetical protein
MNLGHDNPTPMQALQVAPFGRKDHVRKPNLEKIVDKGSMQYGG